MPPLPHASYAPVYPHSVWQKGGFHGTHGTMGKSATDGT